eukprot:gene16205-biopygen23253
MPPESRSSPVLARVRNRQQGGTAADADRTRTGRGRGRFSQ